ncbi:GH19259 [Drosophila grimshawi]|uniref:GH19259 n=1 Tax=Drosophila grimshawi TaxID=7222 RepID=B4JF71_DROGR|nr:GH19259 [Drosophila grimshawi]
MTNVKSSDAETRVPQYKNTILSVSNASEFPTSRNYAIYFKTNVEKCFLTTKIHQHSLNSFTQGTKNPKYIESIKSDPDCGVVPMRVFRDQVDWSRHPSFSMKKIDYQLECEMRYAENREKYNAQLNREMEFIISSKQMIYDQYFTRRVLSYTTFWPPLHTKPELDIFIKKFFQLTSPQKKRLNYLMNTELSFI